MAKLVRQVRELQGRDTGKPAPGPGPAAKVTAASSDEDGEGMPWLSFGMEAQGQIDPGGDTDSYLFWGEEGQTVDLSLTGDFDTYLEVSFDGETIATNDDGGEGNNSLLDDFILPATGEFVAVARAYSPARTGSYTLLLSEGPPPASLAGEVMSGETYGSLTAGETQVYSFSVYEPAFVTLGLSSTDFDTYLSLYAGSTPQDVVSDHLVDSDDDGGEGPNSLLAMELQPGDYLVEVRSYSPATGGDYTLSLVTQAVAADEDAAGPVWIALGSPLEGVLSAPGDTDRYAFWGEEGQQVDISLTSSYFDTYLTLEFEGVAIAEDDDGGVDRNSLLDDFVLPASGEYVIQASSYGDAEAGAYTLGLTEGGVPVTLYGEAQLGPNYGTLEAGTVHLYTLRVPESSEWVVSLESDAFDPYLSLYAGASAADRRPESLVDSDDDSGDGLNSLIRLLLDPGQYLIEVRGLGAEDYGDYVLSVTQTPAVADEDTGGPVPMGYGEVRGGALLPSGDTDTFVFSGTRGDAIDVAVESPEFDTYVEVQRDGEVIGWDDDGGEGTNSLVNDLVLPVSGEYTIHVYPYDGFSTGAYTVTLLQGRVDAVLQGEVLEGQTYGWLDAGGKHFYHLALAAQTFVVIDLGSDEFDPYLSLYTGSSLADWLPENLIDANDDWDGLNSHLELALEAGDYLLEVQAYAEYQLGQYWLTVSSAAVAGDEDSAGPLPLAYDEPASGALMPIGDWDEYTFWGSEGEVVALEARSPEFDTYLELELDGLVIAADDDGGEGTNSLIEELVLPASGQYLVRLSSYGYAGAGGYSLALRQGRSPFTYMGLLSEEGADLYLRQYEIHLYPLVVPSLSQVVLSVDTEAFDPLLVLYLGSGIADRRPENILALDDDSGEGLNALLGIQLDAGNYLVEVRAVQGDLEGPYALGLEMTDLGADEDFYGPVALPEGVPLSGGIFPPGDVDAYEFAGQAGQVVDLWLDSPDFDAYLELELNGAVVAVDDDGGEGLNSLLEGFVLPEDGRYVAWAHVLGDGGMGHYTIGLEDVTPQLAVRPALSAGSTSDQLDEAEMLHLYPLEVPKLSQARIDLVSDAFDAYLALYVGTGAHSRSYDNLVAEDDDGGGGLNSRINALLSPGTYLVEARSLSGTAVGEYTLTVALLPVADDEDDPLPPVIAYGQVRSGNLVPVGDSDTYRLTAQAGDVVDVSLVSPDASVDTYLEVLRDGEVLASDDDGGENLNSLIEDLVIPASGEYLVIARSYGDAGSGGYVLTVTGGAAALAVRDSLTAGKRSDQIEAAGGIHLHPLVLAERAAVRLEVTGAAFASRLVLFGGRTAADRVPGNLVAQVFAAARDTARIEQELPAGAYLVEVGPTDPAQRGRYSLELQVTSVAAQGRSRLAIASGRLNGSALNTFDPVVVVTPGEKVTGSLTIQLTNANPGSRIFPLGATASWGDRRAAYWQVVAWAPPGQSSQSVTVDLTAPSTPGTYYILLAAAAEASVASIMSGTHWVSGAVERWDDADDVAAWSPAQIQQALGNGWVSAQWYDGYAAEIAAAVVRVEVEAPVVLAAGPVTLDLDPADGDQAQTLLSGVTAGQDVPVELHIAGAPQISGWSVRVDFDTTQVRYTSGSFTPATFLPGLVALQSEQAGYVEVGGAVLGTGTTASGDGFLGTLRFTVQEGLAQAAYLTLTQVTLRTTEQGRVKQDVHVQASLEPSARLADSPVTLDFDLDPGDQQRRRYTGATAGAQVQVQLHVTDAPEVRGWGARLEFDPARVRYVSGSFEPSAFIRGLMPLVGEKEMRVDLGGAVLGTGATGSGSGALGTLSFALQPGFADSALVVITQFRLNTVAAGEVIQAVRAVAVITTQAEAEPALAADFSGDGVVDFSDFFAFADAFGQEPGDANWNAACDLNGDGQIDFTDFFAFADQFGQEERGKLLALARRYLGLPGGPELEPNRPNPFNASTTIRYRTAEAGLVRLTVYDASGQRLRDLVDAFVPAGLHQAVWDGTDGMGQPVSTGVYICRLQSGGEEKLRKLLLLK
ncbi:MAG: pre-peptidase C-terminal domain-containing protein [Candidatus Latescibacterota bacterium]